MGKLYIDVDILPGKRGLGASMVQAQLPPGTGPSPTRILELGCYAYVAQLQRRSE